MAAQSTFRQSRMSGGWIVVLIAVAAGFLLGGASGYFVRGSALPTSTGTPVVTISQATPQRTILPNQP